MEFKHIGICVNSIDECLEKWKVFGVEIVCDKAEFPGQTSCLVSIGGTNIELMEPRGEGTVKKFIEKNGEGLHHLSVRVDDIHEAVAAFGEAGLGVLHDGKAPVAFVKPKGNCGVLFEVATFADVDAVEAAK